MGQGLSQREVALQVGIKSHSLIRQWLRLYQTGGTDALTPKPCGRKPIKQSVAQKVTILIIK